ncbi:MAG: DUF4349 domain-containing protein [Proteobacteria bacterium]|jgi:hypothetical protein|nr:DUF4349 domain-containing protein [Pseudomonadota bacterium]
MRRSRFVVPALIAALALAGCGGAMYKAEPSYNQAYAGAPSPEMVAEAESYPSVTGTASTSVDSEDYMFEFDDDAVQGKHTSADGASFGSPSSPEKKPYEPGDKAKQSGDGQANQNAGAKSDAPDVPMVVYTGYLRLRVKRLLEAVDEVTRITESQKGYIESLAQRVVVVRIPAKDFDAVMAEFAKLGELLERRIKALDVTEQFTDLGARLAVAKEAQSRLIALLAKTEDVEERLRILQEVKRLSEQIELIESTLSTLQNLVDYFTITIELEPIMEDSGGDLHRSPFAWIRGLAAHVTTLWDGKDEFDLELPQGFVLFEKDDVYRAQSADTTVIRGAVVDNEPRGDNAYWIKAVHHEMEGRAEKLEAEGDSGPIAYKLYKSEDVQPRYYLIGVAARGEDLYVLEVFFPNEEALAAHKDAVIKALATFEVQ